MAEEQNKQNKKKAPSPGKKKAKKGSPAKRSFLLKPATLIFVILATLLLLLSGVYFARTHHWFASPSSKGQVVVHPEPSPSPLLLDRGAPPEAATVEPATPAEVSHPVPSTVPTQKGAVHPRVAIIVDDLGADLPFLRELLALKMNLTVAVLPDLPHSAESARLAHAAGQEILLHIPMEPRNYPAAKPGREPLLVKLPAEEIRRRLSSYFETVPYAVGGNNHMGSRYTEDREGMAVVLALLKERGMFFVDSRTTAQTVAIEEAIKVATPNAERDVFLDNEAEIGAIREQMHELVRIAREKGSAIGIGHPHPATLQALKEAVPELTRQGISLVAVSALVH